MAAFVFVGATVEFNVHGSGSCLMLNYLLVCMWQIPNFLSLVKTVKCELEVVMRATSGFLFNYFRKFKMPMGIIYVYVEGRTCCSDLLKRAVLSWNMGNQILDPFLSKDETYIFFLLIGCEESGCLIFAPLRITMQP